MKIILLFSFLILTSSFAHAQYNQALADSLGADEHGMKKYVLAILKTGENTTSDKAISDSLFKGHMNNIQRLSDMHKLAVAGPLGKNEKAYRGIFILDVPTIDEARALVDTDPAVKAKLFEVEYFVWYGSAALPVYLKTHEKIQKAGF